MTDYVTIMNKYPAVVSMGFTVNRFTSIFQIVYMLFKQRLFLKKLARGLPDIATSNLCGLDSKSFIY